MTLPAFPYEKFRRPPAAPSPDISEARLKRSLAAAAYVVAVHGERYAPLFDRLERELAEFRARSSPAERARRYLELEIGA